MNFKLPKLPKLPEGLSTAMAHKSLTLQKHSPTLLFGAGIVGVVATTVVACRATLKLDEALTKEIATAETIKSMDNLNYTDQDRSRDLTIVYTRTAVTIGKLYAPAVILGVASVACLTSSHHILKTRNTGLMIAYAGVEKAFKEYRARVEEAYGTEKEHELRYGTDLVETVDAEGHITKRLKVSPDGHSIYSRIFDESNPNWRRADSHNQMFVQCQQTMANRILEADGHIFLNDVYKMLGFPVTSEGQLVGWVLDGSKTSDNYVDFGYSSANKWNAMEFVNGEERNVILDFNVDGVVWDKIK